MQLRGKVTVFACCVMLSRTDKRWRLIPDHALLFVQSKNRFGLWDSFCFRFEFLSPISLEKASNFCSLDRSASPSHTGPSESSKTQDILTVVAHWSCSRRKMIILLWAVTFGLCRFFGMEVAIFSWVVQLPIVWQSICRVVLLPSSGDKQKTKVKKKK